MGQLPLVLRRAEAADFPGYPSAALFQKPVDQIGPPEEPLFRKPPGYR
jgi:hypothetical protein